MPATQRRASNEPSPGVASWLTSAAFRALVRLRGFWAGRGKDVFVSIHHGHEADGNGNKYSNTAGQDSTRGDQAHDQQESKHNEPMFGNHLAAQLHGFPKAQLSVNYKWRGEIPGHRQIDSGND